MQGRYSEMLIGIIQFTHVNDLFRKMFTPFVYVELLNSVIFFFYINFCIH